MTRAALFTLALVGCTTPSPGGTIGPDPVTPKPVASQPTPKASAVEVAKPKRAFQSCAKGPARKPPFTTVRDVDWCNHSFTHGFLELHGGTAEMHEYEELGGMHDTHFRRLGSVAFGDLDGDAIEEAAIVVDEESWFTSNAHSSASTLYVYELVKGAPHERSREVVAFGASVRVEGKKLIVTLD